MQGLVSYFADNKQVWPVCSGSTKSYYVGGVWYANEVQMCKKLSPDQRSVVPQVACVTGCKLQPATVYCELSADTIGLRRVSCHIAELASFWSPFQ